jgi:hypothetical protein
MMQWTLVSNFGVPAPQRFEHVYAQKMIGRSSVESCHFFQERHFIIAKVGEDMGGGPERRRILGPYTSSQGFSTSLDRFRFGEDICLQIIVAIIPRPPLSMV